MKSLLKQRLVYFFLLLVISVSNVQAAMDFSLPGIDGKQYSLSDYRGKWVLVNFWATWCPPCLEEIPELELFHDTHKDKDDLVLGINYENVSDKRLKSFVEDLFVSYPILKLSDSEPTPFGNLPGLPTSFLVSPEGEVVARQVGGITASAIERFIDNYKTDK